MSANRSSRVSIQESEKLQEQNKLRLESVEEEESRKTESEITSEPSPPPSQCLCLMQVTCQKWVKIRSFIGEPELHDFQLQEERLRCIRNGEILIQAMCWTVDNYMKVFDIPLNSVMPGEQVASVINSCHPDYPAETLVVCLAGWRTHTIVNPYLTRVRKVKPLGDLPVSLCLGPLGLPGFMAYFGLLHICRPHPGDKVVINAAAGSVGNVAGQIAKIMGCSVVAFAGTKERCEWCRAIGFEIVYNCNSVAPSPALSKTLPRGIDCYFDTVGAEFTAKVLAHMKPTGKICMFGQAIAYCRQLVAACEYTSPYKLVFMTDKRVTTYSVFDFEDLFDEAEAQLLEWIQHEKLRYSETLIDGFQNLPKALQCLQNKDTVGKIIVKSNDAASLLTMTIPVDEINVEKTGGGEEK